MKEVDRIEDVPYVSVGGLHVIVSFVLLRQEVFDVFGSFEDVVYYTDEVSLRLPAWSAFGITVFDEEAQAASPEWENRNEKALLALAADLGQAKREKLDEERAERR